MRTSYQNATAIYLQRMRVYYRALLITRTNSSYAVPVAGRTPTDDVMPLLPGITHTEQRRAQGCASQGLCTAIDSKPPRRHKHRKLMTSSLRVRAKPGQGQTLYSP
jgi:hypothetical protein